MDEEVLLLELPRQSHLVRLRDVLRMISQPTPQLRCCATVPAKATRERAVTVLSGTQVELVSYEADLEAKLKTNLPLHGEGFIFCPCAATPSSRETFAVMS